MVPMDLGELTADEMMNLFAEFSAWAGYAAVKVAEAEAAEEDVESDLKVAEAKFIITKMEVDEEKITTARLQRDSDPEVIRLAKELRRRRAVRKLLTTYFNNYERSAATLSRELTRRGTLGPHEGRSSRVTVLGCDPGMAGAIAYVHRGKLLEVVDMPAVAGDISTSPC